jgi:hypothetical protein
MATDAFATSARDEPRCERESLGRRPARRAVAERWPGRREEGDVFEILTAQVGFDTSINTTIIQVDC